MENSKNIIGMIHLKALPTSPSNELTIDKIFHYAKEDLYALQDGGVDAAIVENFFDFPYTTCPSLEILTAYIHIFTRLKSITKIPLGVNIQYTSGSEEMIIASLCGADFIRAETFVENRSGSFGILSANCALLTRCRKRLNSQVKIYADIHVKHSFPTTFQPLEYSIVEAVTNYADALIITGLETGQQPSIEDVKAVKSLSANLPLYVGSGIDDNNIIKYLDYVDGVIIGTFFKKDGKASYPISKDRVKSLVSKFYI